MTAPAESRQRFHPATWLLPALLAIYVLSLGPCVALYIRGYFPPGSVQILRTVYAPLEWVRNHSEACGALLDWYVAVCD